VTGEHGGDIVADYLAELGVRHLFTLTGGHISPILVGAKSAGIRVVDVRDEQNAVFAADAMARLTGTIGVAAVTAGPGVTNTITAVKNAQMAQTPLLVLGGATATILKGRGSLQDIDQLSLMKPITKWAGAVKSVPGLRPALHRAVEAATSGVPGPAFLEIPVDLLYPEATVRRWYFKESGAETAGGLSGTAMRTYLHAHLFRQFHVPRVALDVGMPRPRLGRRSRPRLDEAVDALRSAERPVLVVGSQTLAGRGDADRIASSVEALGIPTYLAGSARGLLGPKSGLQFRHKRRAALKEADLVIVAGFPFDFRLGYGRAISSRATVIAANLSSAELTQNRKPELAYETHPADFLEALGAATGGGRRDLGGWFGSLAEREKLRDLEIEEQSLEQQGLVNPLDLFLRLEDRLGDDSVLVVDGGDFVATAAYILRPRRPLSWLDPGPFGTLGVGGGFALAAALARPEAQVWLIYGDGSSAYSLAEFDTFARHGIAPIAIVGSDGAWAQIAREQVAILGDDVATNLLRTSYEEVAAGYGGVGLLLTDPVEIDETLDGAIEVAASGKPVCINVHIDRTDFREGSLSI